MSQQPWNPETYQPLAVTTRRRGRKTAERTMPPCRYGSHCQLPHCIYRHPSPNEARPQRSVCLAYLRDTCEFGDTCWNWHPQSIGERQAILRVLRQRPCTNPKPCPFGADCLFRCSG